MDSGRTECLQYTVCLGHGGQEGVWQCVYDALLKYYEEKNNKECRKRPNEERGKRARLEISDDLAGLFAEALGGDDQSTDDAEPAIVAAQLQLDYILYKM